MDGEVDPAVEQGLVDLLGEQALAADIGERAILDAVAGGRHRVFVEGAHVAQHGTEPADLGQEGAGLGESQRPIVVCRREAGACAGAWAPASNPEP